jgi:hypothetical protein
LSEEEEQKKIAEGPKFRPKKVHKVSILSENRTASHPSK